MHGMHAGALFRAFAELPTFTLHSTGKGAGFFWRQYSLTSSGMTCEINETFADDVFDVLAPAQGASPAAADQEGSVDAYGF